MKKLLLSQLLIFSIISGAFAQQTPTQAQHRVAKIALQNAYSKPANTPIAVTTVAKFLAPAVAGQDCGTAIPVCQNTYTQSTSYTGVGATNEVSNTCLLSGESNSVWYQFTVQSSGTFSFNINTPNDYDWALYNITSSSCSQIPTMTPVSCNYSATYGNTGMNVSSGTTSGNSSLGAGDSPFSPALNVTAGQTFVLIINNFSANSNGYTLSFNAATNGGGGTSTIFDNVRPTLQSVVNNCNNTFTATFSEPIRCSSVSTSAFTVTGGLTITAATGTDCASGNFTRKVLLTVSAPTSCGVYSFNATTALLDACSNPVNPGAAISKVLLSNTITATASAASVCAGAGSSVTLNTPCTAVGATYKWSTGATSQSTAVVPTATTTYTVTVTGADGCTKTATTSVTVNQVPVVTVNKLRGVITASCNPFNVAASGPASTTYAWSPGGATTATLGITTAGTYTVVGTLNGCASAPVSVTVAATPSGCNLVYASPTGGGSGLLATSPADLVSAIGIAECLGATVRMQVGDYDFTAPITLPSNVTLDGGWSAGFANKTSTTGTVLTTTTIRRILGTTTYPYDGTAAAPALIAMKATSATDFRLQDITLATANAPATVQGQSAVSTYGLVLTSCSAYNIVRTQVKPGSAGNGINGVNGTAGGNGTNGAAGQSGDDTSGFGCYTDGSTTGGARGTGGAAGTNPSFPALNGTAGTNGGNGGNGAADDDGAAGSAGIAACGTAGAGGAAVDSDTGCGGNTTGNGKAGGNCSATGVAGANGTTGTASIVSNLYAPGNGTNGVAGTNGGGGGGGGGGGVNQWNCNASGGSGGGGGGGGGGGAAGSGATGAGAAFGIFTNNNTGGTLTQVNIILPVAASGGTVAGTGGSGGTKGTGGAAPGCGGGGGQQNVGGKGGDGTAGGSGGSGGTGSAGIAVTVQNNGTGTAPAYTAFALTTQPQISWDGKSCTNVATSLTATSGATAFTSTGGTYSTPNMTWTSGGRKDVVLSGTNTYAGFVDMTTTAPSVDYTASVPFNTADNVFRVCEGGSLTFFSNIPLDNSITNYKWDFDAASGVADVNSASANTTTATFNTAGASYILSHTVTTACCGEVTQKSYIIRVEPKPNPVVTTATTICNGSSASLTLTPLTAGSVYAWSTAETTPAISVSPTSTTAYTVEETTQYGCKRTSPSVNVTVLNTPTATAATGTRLLCVGASTTLSLSATNSTGFDWTRTGPAGPATSGTGSSIATGNILLAGDYDYTITPKNVSGATTCYGAPLLVKVTVQDLPTVTAVNDICVGTATILTGGASTYALFDAAGTTQLSPATGTAPTVSAAIAAGTNSFQLQGRSFAGCISPKTPITIQGRAIPVVAAASSGNCEGAPMTVSNSASGTGSLTYSVTSITPSSTLPADNATGTFTFPIGTTSANFQITSQYGCVSIAQAVPVNALPTASIAGTTTICNGTNTSLTASTGTSFLWDDNSTAPARSVSPTANASYTVTVTNAAGCTKTTAQLVTVSTNPAATISGTSTICEGSMTTLSASSGASYNWNTSVSTSSISPSPSVNTTYTVTVYQGAGQTGCSRTATQAVAVTANPAATISGTSTICEGSMTTLSASSGASYNWNTSVSTSTISPAPSVNTTYTVTVYQGAGQTGCSRTATQAVAVTANPTILLPNPASICAGSGTVVFTASGASSYTWSSNTTNATGSTAELSSNSAAGTFTVTVTGTAAGCTSSKIASVVLEGATGNVVLATATTNATSLYRKCDDGSGWTYYADPADHEKLLFGIEWSPSGSLTTNNATVKSAATVKINLGTQYGQSIANGYQSKGIWVIPRWWEIHNPTATALDEAVNIRFFYTAAEQAAIKNAAEAFMNANCIGNTFPAAPNTVSCGYEGLTWFKLPGVYSATTASSNITASGLPSNADLLPDSNLAGQTINGQLYAQLEGLTAFSTGTLSAAVKPVVPSLPITLLSFTGKINGDVNDLFWTTANELKSKWHIVERSANGTTGWTEAGRRDGAGTTNTAHSYTLTDKNPLAKSYYRLHEIATDGSSQYSQVILLERRKNSTDFVQVFPNPTTGDVEVLFEATEQTPITLTVIDELGRKLQTTTIAANQGINSTKLNIAELPSAIYMLVMQTGDVRRVVKIVKTN